MPPSIGIIHRGNSMCCQAGGANKSQVLVKVRGKGDNESAMRAEKAEKRARLRHWTRDSNQRKGLRWALTHLFAQRPSRLRLDSAIALEARLLSLRPAAATGHKAPETGQGNFAAPQPISTPQLVGERGLNRLLAQSDSQTKSEARPKSWFEADLMGTPAIYGRSWRSTADPKFRRAIRATP